MRNVLKFHLFRGILKNDRILGIAFANFSYNVLFRKNRQPRICNVALNICALRGRVAKLTMRKWFLFFIMPIYVTSEKAEIKIAKINFFSNRYLLKQAEFDVFFQRSGGVVVFFVI